MTANRRIYTVEIGVSATKVFNCRANSSFIAGSESSDIFGLSAFLVSIKND